MTGLRVFAEMAEPIIHYGDGLHLDGILSYGVWQQLPDDERDALPPISGPWAVDLPLPLERWSLPGPPDVHPQLRDEGGNVWGWLASQCLTPWQKQGVHEVRKRPAVAELVRWSEAKSYNPGLGPMKAYDLAYPTVWAHRLEWVAVGDADGVRSALFHVHGIGKATHHGNGRVLRWVVEADAAVTPDVVLSHRRVPAASEAEATGHGSIRPPYHHASRRCWIVEPQ